MSTDRPMEVRWSGASQYTEGEETNIERGTRQAKTKLAGEAISKFINDYVGGYEFEGGGTYTPNDHERTLIEDAIRGLIANDEFAAMFAVLMVLIHSANPEAAVSGVSEADIDHALSLPIGFRGVTVKSWLDRPTDAQVREVVRMILASKS